MSTLLAAAALAAQQHPIAPGGLVGARLRVAPEAVRCIEQQVPPLEQLAQRVAPEAILQHHTAPSPELESLLAEADRCLSALPAVEHDPATFSRRYLIAKASVLVAGRYFMGVGISYETLRRLAASRNLIWLNANTAATDAAAPELEALFRRLRIPPPRRREAILYVVLERSVALLERTMRPPVQRASYLGGAIEVGDYPREPLRTRVEGDGSILFEVRPDGTIGRCLAVRTTGSADFGRAACRAVSRRHRYAPARDEAGRPTFDAVNVTIHWRLPR